LNHLLFAAYLLLFSWLVTKVGFFKKAGLSSTTLIILFLIKVLAGIFYGWLGVYYGKQLQMVDTWYFHSNSLKEYQLLMDHPWDFFTSLFHNRYEEGFSKFLTSKDSWWNDVKYIFFDKLLALFNLFSFGNYYINVIFYSLITLFGPVAIYRILKETFPKRERVLLIAVFLVPSFIFWNSGIHKDGLVFLSFALLSYHFYFGFKQGRFPAERLSVIALAFILLIVRSFVLVVLLPALFAWYLSLKSRYKSIYVFGGVYALFTIIFFTLHYIYPKANLMQAVASRQQEFMSLHGNSSIQVRPLEPTFSGFVKNAPQALSNTLLRPAPSDVHHTFSLLACIETMLFIALFIVFLFFRKKEDNLTPYLLYSFLLGVSMLLMIGYTVNILGAIVRYRSIAIPFLLAPIIAMTDWKKLKARIY
jgi:hypothetical protein